MPVSGDWKGGGIRQNIEMTGKALFGQTIRKSPKAALLVLPKPSTFVEIVDRGRQGFRCVFLLRGGREIFCARYGKIAGCAENSSQEKGRIPSSTLLQTLAVVSLPVIASARAVSVVRQRSSFSRPITMPPKKRNIPDDGTCNLRFAATFPQENLLQAALRYLSNTFLLLSKLPYPAHFTVRQNEGGRKSFQQHPLPSNYKYICQSSFCSAAVSRMQRKKMFPHTKASSKARCASVIFMPSRAATAVCLYVPAEG